MDRFDIVEGHYWWLVEHHRGQGDERYSRLCRIGRYFRPGALANGPRGDAADVYASLCERNGCGQGYHDCGCRDCMDVAIGGGCRGLCKDCRAAGCPGDGECEREDAYSDED